MPRPERDGESRTPDVDRSDHFLIPHAIHDDGRITCVCREIRVLRDKPKIRPLRDALTLLNIATRNSHV